jgi:monoamine oxidase
MKMILFMVVFLVFLTRNGNKNQADMTVFRNDHFRMWPAFFLTYAMDKVIVVGAGAAGLMAARLLSARGQHVTILESRGRTGGRIFTSTDGSFSAPIDNGAEFVHGEPPLLMSIVKEAGVKLRKGNGKMWYVRDGRVAEEGPFEEGWSEFMNLLNKLEVDMPIAEFLNTRFKSDLHKNLRESVNRFVQGFDAADPSKASAFSLRDEWSEADDAITGQHMEGGYSQVIQFLEKECVKQGVQFHLTSQVHKIHWQPGRVVVSTNTREFEGRTCVVTIPPAVLTRNTIEWSPRPNEHLTALSKIETGGVVKFLLEFKDLLWEPPGRDAIRLFPKMHFLFSDATVPTWWSQRPSSMPLLTGWLSGPATQGLAKPEHELMHEGIRSLAYIFGTHEDEIVKRLRASKVINWVNDPFAMGAYAYRTVGIQSTLEFLHQSISQTIFFAGEAYNTGEEMGTVEAALASGKATAYKVFET